MTRYAPASPRTFGRLRFGAPDFVMHGQHSQTSRDPRRVNVGGACDSSFRKTIRGFDLGRRPQWDRARAPVGSRRFALCRRGSAVCREPRRHGR